jgi:hypothetical protein
VKVLISILFVILLLPVLVVVGIALGPAILVILFVLCCAVPVLLLERVWSRHRQHVRVRAPRG